MGHVPTPTPKLYLKDAFGPRRLAQTVMKGRVSQGRAGQGALSTSEGGWEDGGRGVP